MLAEDRLGIYSIDAGLIFAPLWPASWFKRIGYHVGEEDVHDKEPGSGDVALLFERISKYGRREVDRLVELAS